MLQYRGAQWKYDRMWHRGKGGLKILKFVWRNLWTALLEYRIGCFEQKSFSVHEHVSFRMVSETELNECKVHLSIIYIYLSTCSKTLCAVGIFTLCVHPIGIDLGGGGLKEDTGNCNALFPLETQMLWSIRVWQDEGLSRNMRTKFFFFFYDSSFWLSVTSRQWIWLT